MFQLDRDQLEEHNIAYFLTEAFGEVHKDLMCTVGIESTKPYLYVYRIRLARFDSRFVYKHVGVLVRLMPDARQGLNFGLYLSKATEESMKMIIDGEGRIVGCTQPLLDFTPEIYHFSNQ